MPSRLVLSIVAAGALALGATPPAQAAQTNVAVAANFTDAAKEIAAAFKEKTGHEAILSFGSTGQLYTQITQGAPFEVFLVGRQRAAGEGATTGSRSPAAVSPMRSASSCSEQGPEARGRARRR